MTDTDAQVRNLLTELMGEAIAETGDVRREDVTAWDSIKHVDLIFLLEETFDVVLDEADMASMDSVGRIVEIVEARRAA